MNENINVLSAGERFTFKDFEWVTLGQADGGVLAIMADIWTIMPFRDNGSSDYRKSGVRACLLENLLPVLGEDNLLPHTVDLLSDDGIDLYGTVTDKVFILSCDEYRRYRKFMPQHDTWVWTCTPWTIDQDASTGYDVRSIGTTGTLNYTSADSTRGVAPACILNPESLNLRRQAQVVEV